MLSSRGAMLWLVVLPLVGAEAAPMSLAETTARTTPDVGPRRRRDPEVINRFREVEKGYEDTWNSLLAELRDYETNTYQAKANQYGGLAGNINQLLDALEKSSKSKQTSISTTKNSLGPRVTAAKTAGRQAFDRTNAYLDSEDALVNGDIKTMKNRFVSEAQKAQQKRTEETKKLQEMSTSESAQMKTNVDAFTAQLATSLDRISADVKRNSQGFEANATIFGDRAEEDVEKQTVINGDIRKLEDKWSQVFSALIDHAGDGYMEGMGGYKRGLKQAETQAQDDITAYMTKMEQELPKLRAKATGFIASLSGPAQEEQAKAEKRSAWLGLIAQAAYAKFSREGSAALKRAQTKLKTEQLTIDEEQNRALNQEERASTSVETLAEETNAVDDSLKTHVETLQDKNDDEAEKFADNLARNFAKWGDKLNEEQEFGAKSIEMLVNKMANNIADTATGKFSTDEMKWIGAMEMLQKALDRMKKKDEESNSQLKTGGEALAKSEGMSVQLGKILTVIDALAGTIDEKLTATHAEIRRMSGEYERKIGNLKDENRNSVDLIVQKIAEHFSEAKNKLLAKFKVAAPEGEIKAVEDKSEGIQTSLDLAAKRMNKTFQGLQNGESLIVSLPIQVENEELSHKARLATLKNDMQEEKAEVANYAVDQFALAKGNISDAIAYAEERAQNGTDRNEAWLAETVVDLNKEVETIQNDTAATHAEMKTEMEMQTAAAASTDAASAKLLEDGRAFTERNEGKIQEGMSNASEVEQGIKTELAHISSDAQEEGANISQQAQNGTAKIDAVAEDAAVDSINQINHEASVYDKQLHDGASSSTKAVDESITNADVAQQDAAAKLGGFGVAGKDRSAVNVEKAAAQAVEEGVSYAQNMGTNLTDERNKARTYGHTGVRAMSSEWQKEWIDLHNRDSAAIRKLHDTLKAQGRDTVTDLKTYLATAKTSATEMANQLGLSENELHQMLRTLDADAALLFSSQAHAKEQFDETVGDIEGQLGKDGEHTRENEGAITAHIQSLMRSLGLEQAHAAGELSNMEIGFLQELAVLNTSHLHEELTDRIDALHVKKNTKMVELNMTLDAIKKDISDFQHRVIKNTVIQKDKWVKYVPLINDTNKDIKHMFNETEHLALNDRQTVLDLLDNLTSTEAQLRDYVQFENARMQQMVEDTRSTGFGAGVPQLMNFMNKFEENTTFAEMVQKTTELVQNQTDIDSDLKNSIDYEVAPRVAQWRQGINEVMGQLGMEIDMDKVNAVAEAQASGGGGVSVTENMFNEAAQLKDYVRMLGRLTKEKMGKAGASLGKVLGHLKRGRRAEVAAMERRLRKIIDQATLDGNTAADDSRELSTRMGDATRESENLRRDVQLTLLRIQNELFNKDDNSPSRADLEAKQMVMNAEFAHASLLETASRLPEDTTHLPPVEAAAAFRKATQQLRTMQQLPDSGLERDIAIVSHM